MSEEEPTPPPTTLREACTCGAEVEMQGPDGGLVLKHVKGWRKTHRCEPSEEKKRVVGFTSDHEAV